MTAPVFVIASDRVREARPGDIVVLDGPEGRHAGVVQRLAAGELIDLVDGDGLRVHGRVATVTGADVAVEVIATEREATDQYRIVLAQALAKGDRDDLAIEAATELGVDGVVPWQAQRSIVVWRRERAERSLARWRATVRAATKQSRRAHEPFVDPLVSSAELVARTREVTAAGGHVLVLHETATLPLAHVVLTAGDEPTTPVEVLVVVGPEGGISGGELDDLTAAGGVLVRLGPHVLRTSTAGPVAVALLSERLGRWDRTAQ